MRSLSSSSFNFLCLFSLFASAFNELHIFISVFFALIRNYVFVCLHLMRCATRCYFFCGHQFIVCYSVRFRKVKCLSSSWQLMSQPSIIARCANIYSFFFCFCFMSSVVDRRSIWFLLMHDKRHLSTITNGCYGVDKSQTDLKITEWPWYQFSLIEKANEKKKNTNKSEDEIWKYVRGKLNDGSGRKWIVSCRR